MKQTLFFFLALILIAFGGTYVYLDRIIKMGLEDYGTNALKVDVKIGYIYLHPLKGHIIIRNLSIDNPKGFPSPHAFEVEQVSISLDIKTIFKDVIQINEIIVQNPIITYEIGMNGINNIQVLKNNTQSSVIEVKEKPNDSSNNQKVVINQFYLNKAEVIASLGNIEKRSFVMPNIHLSNIGKKEDGITIAEANEQVIAVIIKVLSKVDLKTLFKETVNDIEGSVTSGFKGTTNIIDKFLGN